MFLEQVADRNILNSLKQMQNLQRQLNHLLSLEEDHNTNYQYPPLNLWVSAEAAIVEVELPGVELNDIEITVVANSLTLKGCRKKEDLKVDEAYNRQESFLGNFTRSIQVPFTIEADKVNAELNRGILKVNLPRAEADKPKKISIQSAS